jgi:hypothetical protein
MRTESTGGDQERRKRFPLLRTADVHSARRKFARSPALAISRSHDRAIQEAWDGAARDAAWAAFQADPEWVKTRTEMQVNVQVENVFMSATDYSPMK